MASNDGSESGTRHECPKCNGEGERDAILNGERRTIVCGDCAGSGVVEITPSYDADCATCNGSGKVTR